MPERTTVVCPECSVKLKLNLAGQDLTGKQVKCPKCSTRFAVEQAVTSGIEAPTTDHENAPPDALREPVKRGDNSPSKAKQREAAASGQRSSSFNNRDSFDDINETRSVNSGQGFLGWLIFGLGTGLACAALTAAAGFSGNTMLVAGCAVVTGIAVGIAIRAVGGRQCGAASAMVAVLIALCCMFAGKVGAFWVSPELNDFSNFADGMEPMSLEQKQEIVESESSEDSIISEIAGELESDSDWLKEQEITEEMITDYWDEIPEGDDVAESSKFLPQIWEEAVARWNEKSADQKQELIEAKKKQLRADYGIMNEAEVGEEIDKATSDEQMIRQIAWEVSYDEDWLEKNELTEDTVDDSSGDVAEDAEPSKDGDIPVVVEDTGPSEDAESSEEFTPAVLEEATRRWNELSPAEKKVKLAEREEEVKLQYTYSEEQAEMENAVVGFFKVFFIVVAAIAHFFVPVGSLLCTIAGLLAALGIASGLPSVN